MKSKRRYNSIQYLFGCASNQRAVALYRGDEITRVVVQDYNGYRLTEYNTHEVANDALPAWVAKTVGDAIIQCSSEQLDAVIEALMK